MLGGCDQDGAFPDEWRERRERLGGAPSTCNTALGQTVRMRIPKVLTYSTQRTWSRVLVALPYSSIHRLSDSILLSSMKKSYLEIIAPTVRVSRT